MKADVQGFPKMWYFSQFEGFKAELWLFKVGSNLKIFLGRLAASKKKTRLQYCTEGRHMNRIGFSHGKFDILFISGLKTAY